MRKIIHIDMDAFYASVEQRDDPSLRGKPLAVGYSGPRGVVAAASYEARRYGVRSAMPSVTARRLCPQLIFVPGRFDVYRSVSHCIMDIFHEYTDLVEPLSLDEAFLDVTENHMGIASATEVARQIREKIKHGTGLTASAGVSVNKFLAKIASDHLKPDGLFVIKPRMVDDFIAGLPIERFYGVGKVTASKMHSLGIHTGQDLRGFTKDQLRFHFGKAGGAYYQYARGEDERPVTPERIRKSLGAENTFMNDLRTADDLIAELIPIVQKVWDRLRVKDFRGRTVTLKVKFGDFRQITRSVTLPRYVDDERLLMGISREMLESVDPGPAGIRLLGVTVSNNDIPSAGPVQLKLDLDR